MTVPSLFYAAALGGSALAAFGQVCMKHAARRPSARVAAMYGRPAMLAGYLLILASTVVNNWAYGKVPARFAAAFLPVNLLLVALLSAGLLGERLNPRQRAGLGVILLGAAIFALG
jgi:multidrug transporter EmrE-like cation transporter